MTRALPIDRRAALALAVALVAAASAPAQQPAAAPAAVSPASTNAGTPVRLMAENEKPMDVMLMLRKGDEIFYRLPNAPAGVMASFKFDRYQEAEFRFTLNEEQAYAYAFQRKWAQAAQLIHAAIFPTLPYLDLPENNATDPAIRAGRAYIRAAEQLVEAGGETNVAAAMRYYASAYQVLDAAGRAAWHPYGESAHLRSLLCLIELGKLDDAEKSLKATRVPEIGDASWGVYYLTKATLLYRQEKVREALDSAVLSYIHENKDVETFPDALMLAAQCYEDVNEPHRARDVYYEVARLFPGTDWGDEAKSRLQFIMDNGMTSKPEEANLAGVFFGTEEDMNGRANDFLKGIVRSEPKPEKKPKPKPKEEGKPKEEPPPPQPSEGEKKP